VATPTAPVLSTSTTTLSSTSGHRPVARQGGEEVRLEVELQVIMGKTARDVPSRALSYVFGYATGQRLLRRDLQLRDGRSARSS